MKTIKSKLKNRIYFISSFILAALLVYSCQTHSAELGVTERITESEIKRFQSEWALSFIGISNAKKNDGNFKGAAQRHVQNLYGFDEGKVLYKPYNTMDKSFRTTEEGAISYLIGDNKSFPEDQGFALEAWKNVRFENIGIINDSSIAIAMGTLYFEHDNGSETRKNYTLCFKRNAEGKLKIIAQKSSFPCDKNENLR